MSSIEISTTQNVVIEYELAHLRDRIFAFMLDILIIWGVIVFSTLIFNLFVPKGTNYYSYFLYFFTIPFFLFYSLFSEILTGGQSLGKKILKIKIVRTDGTEVTLSDYFIRWSFRLVDIYFSLGALASILINSSDKGQRLGDFLANTTVIRLRPKMNLVLKDILKISSLENYQPFYKNVTELSEKEMIFIKAAFEQALKYPNEAHKEAITMLVQKIMHKLSISEKPNNNTTFLRTLIKDYIVLTR